MNKQAIADMLASVQRQIEQVSGRLARSGNVLDGTPFIVAECGGTGRGIVNVVERHPVFGMLPIDLLGVPHYGREAAERVAAQVNAECGQNMQAVDYREWLADELRGLRSTADMLARLARE